MKEARQYIFIPFTLLLVITTFTFSGCGKKGINGHIIDSAGIGLKGVSVDIEKSSFTTVTDDGGNYLIDYVPGNFTIVFSKNGYTTHKVELNISSKTLFPAESIMMYPIPEEEGLYFLEGNKLISLNPIRINKYVSNTSKGKHIIYSVDVDISDLFKSFIPESGVIQFIDTSPEDERFARIEMEDLLIENYYYSWGDYEYVYNGFIKDDIRKIGEEQLILRSIKYDPGAYCIVGVTKRLSGIIHTDENKKAYPFIVPIAKEDRQAINNFVNEFSLCLKDSASYNYEKAKKLDPRINSREEYQRIKDEIHTLKLLGILPGDIENTAKALVDVEVKNGEKMIELIDFVKIDNVWYFR